MNQILTVACCALTGGVAGAVFSHLTARPRGRRRGAHRPWWRSARTPGSEADTAQLPVLRDHS